MKKRAGFSIAALALMLCLQAPCWAQPNTDEEDEGGIGGTGISDSKRHRPDSIERPDMPERIERIEVPERPEIDTPERPDVKSNDIISPTDVIKPGPRN